MQTSRQMLQALWLALAGTTCLWPARAQVAADPLAAAGRRPVVQMVGALPVINIALPNTAGVSHNLYRSFNVPANGLVLNNALSATAVTAPAPPPPVGPSPPPPPVPPPCFTKCSMVEALPAAGKPGRGLARQDPAAAMATATAAYNIGPNPFLAGRAARLIVNEVTGAEPSNLLGGLTVAGFGADVVIANPFGLSCNGCGFANVQRASLVSGRPAWAGTSLDSFSVTGGSVTVGASGLSGPTLGTLDLIGGRVVVAGPVSLPAAGSAAHVVAGPNQVAYATLVPTSLARADAWPAQVLEVTSAGGMYAQQIFLVAGEQGAGVNLAGHLQAGTGGVTVDVAGNLQLAGHLQSAGGVAVSAGQAAVSQLRLATDSLAVLQTTGALSLQGSDLQAANLLVSSGTGLVASQTQLSARGDVRVVSGGEATFTAGRVAGGGQVSLQAEGELNLLPAASMARAVSGATTRETTLYTRAEVSAGADLVAQSRSGLLTLDGAQLSAGEALSLQGAGVALLARKDSSTETTTTSTTTTRPSTESPVGTRLQAGGDIAVLASGTGADLGHLLATGAQIESRDGHIALLAARNLDVTHDITTDRFYERFYQVRRRLFSKKVTEHIKSSVDETVQAGLVSGRSVSLGAGGNLSLVGSAVFGDGAVGLQADGDLNLLSAAEHDYADSLRTVKKTGIFGNGGLSITIGSKSSTTFTSNDTRLQHGASVASLAGDIAATAGGQYLQLSSDLTAPLGDIRIAAANVAIQSRSDTTSLLNLVRQRQSGLTLSASHPLVQTVQTIDQMAKLASRTDNGRFQALALLTSGLTVYNNFGQLSPLGGINPISNPGSLTGSNLASAGWTLNISLGASSSSFESVSKTSTPVSSAIDAGRNLHISAQGSGLDQGDISLVAAKLSAGGDVALMAQRDITLAAAVGSTSDTTRSQASTGAVGISLGTGGASATLQASRSNGWSNGWGATYYQSEVAAGNNLAMHSGRHTALQGAKASGQGVLARVGTSGAGDLAVSSPLDESHYAAREASSGFNVSVPIPGLSSAAAPPSLGLSASNLQMAADFEAVRQQSAINAGARGFDISVNGHTHLRGGAITTEGAPSNSRLETQTLTHESVQNRDVAEGRGWSIGLSVTDTSMAPEGQQKGALAGSAVGFARIDTQRHSHTDSGVAGQVIITRPDLEAVRDLQRKATEREPLELQRAQWQRDLMALRAAGPECGIGCVPMAVPQAGDTEPAAPAAAGHGATAFTGETGLVDAWPLGKPRSTSSLGGSSARSDWLARIAMLEAGINGLSARIAAINAKIYPHANTLSGSPSVMHQPLQQAFDARKATQELRDGVAVTAAFGKAAFKAVGAEADNRRRAALAACAYAAACAEAEKWSETGAYRRALHMAVGALSFGGAGAVGNLSGSLAIEAVDKALAAQGISDAGTVNLLKMLAAAAAGAAAGSAQGATVAFNADANNRQLHPDEYARARWLARKYAGQLNITESELEARILRQIQRNVDFETAKADGFRVDELVVGKFSCAELKCNYYRTNSDYYDPTVNQQFIPANLAAYRAAVAQREQGITAAERLQRSQRSSLVLGVVSDIYSLLESAYVLAAGKNFAGEDETRWLGAFGVATAGVGRVGTKLYQLEHVENLGEVLLVNAYKLSGKWVDGAGNIIWRNPLTNVLEAVPAGNVLTVDHVLPRNFAENMRGWNLLSKSEQNGLLNSADNLQPMLKSPNCSKGCRVELSGNGGWESWLGQPVSTDYRAWLEREQRNMRTRIDQAIASKR